MSKVKYRVGGVGIRGEFSTFERALKRAREMRTLCKRAFDVFEVDEFGNETPVAHVAPKKPAKMTAEPSTNYARA